MIQSPNKTEVMDPSPTKFHEVDSFLALNSQAFSFSPNLLPRADGTDYVLPSLTSINKLPSEESSALKAEIPLLQTEEPAQESPFKSCNQDQDPQENSHQLCSFTMKNCSSVLIANFTKNLKAYDIPTVEPSVFSTIFDEIETLDYGSNPLAHEVMIHFQNIINEYKVSQAARMTKATSEDHSQKNNEAQKVGTPSTDCSLKDSSNSNETLVGTPLEGSFLNGCNNISEEQKPSRSDAECSLKVANNEGLSIAELKSPDWNEAKYNHIMAALEKKLQEMTNSNKSTASSNFDSKTPFKFLDGESFESLTEHRAHEKILSENTVQEYLPNRQSNEIFESISKNVHQWQDSMLSEQTAGQALFQCPQNQEIQNNFTEPYLLQQKYPARKPFKIIKTERNLPKTLNNNNIIRSDDSFEESKTQSDIRATKAQALDDENQVLQSIGKRKGIHGFVANSASKGTEVNQRSVSKNKDIPNSKFLTYPSPFELHLNVEEENFSKAKIEKELEKKKKKPRHFEEDQQKIIENQGSSKLFHKPKGSQNDGSDLKLKCKGLGENPSKRLKTENPSRNLEKSLNENDEDRFAEDDDEYPNFEYEHNKGKNCKKPASKVAKNRVQRKPKQNRLMIEDENLTLLDVDRNKRESGHIVHHASKDTQERYAIKNEVENIEPSLHKNIFEIEEGINLESKVQNQPRSNKRDFLKKDEDQRGSKSSSSKNKKKDYDDSVLEAKTKKSREIPCKKLKTETPSRHLERGSTEDLDQDDDDDDDDNDEQSAFQNERDQERQPGYRKNATSSARKEVQSKLKRQQRTSIDGPPNGSQSYKEEKVPVPRSNCNISTQEKGAVQNEPIQKKKFQPRKSSVKTVCNNLGKMFQVEDFAKDVQLDVCTQNNVVLFTLEEIKTYYEKNVKSRVKNLTDLSIAIGNKRLSDRVPSTSQEDMMKMAVKDTFLVFLGNRGYFEEWADKGYQPRPRIDKKVKEEERPTNEDKKSGLKAYREKLRIDFEFPDKGRKPQRGIRKEKVAQDEQHTSPE